MADMPSELLAFSNAMEKNLSDAGVPAKLFGQDLLSLLLEFAVEFLQGCQQKKSSRQIARDMQDLSMVQKFILKRRLARKVYRGTTNFEANDGPKTVDVLINTMRNYDVESLRTIVDYFDENDIPEVNPDPIPVDFPAL